MPLPRLGCGGPTQGLNDCHDEQDGCDTPVSTALQVSDTDDESQATPCQSDPYAQLHDEMPESIKNLAHGRLSDDQNTTVATAQSSEVNEHHLNHAKFFYDDPAFDHQVMLDLNKTAGAGDQSESFQAGAVPGFAVKREHPMPEAASKYQKCQQSARRRSLADKQADDCLASETVPGNAQNCNHANAQVAHAASSGSVHLSDDCKGEASGTPACNASAEPHVNRDTQIIEMPVVQQVGTPVPNDNSQEPAESLTVYVVEPGEGYVALSFCPGSTVGQIVAASNAEASTEKYQGITTIFGTQLEHDVQLQNKGWYMLRYQEEGEQGDSASPPILANKTRGRLVWDQRGWVAVDEMEYYLYMLECYTPGTMYGVLILPDRPDAHTMLTEYVLRVTTEAGVDQEGLAKAFVIHHANHWTPVVIRVQGITIQLWTTPSDEQWIRPLIESTVGNEAIQFATSPVPQAFKADCGFQAVGWILSMLLDDTTQVPFSEDQAAQWRALFFHDLQHTGASEVNVFHPIILGGMQSQRDQLQKLVAEHGVAPGRSRECADQLVQALGGSSIQQILASPRPWADLKSRASLLRPPIRIVLSDELKQLIQNKVQTQGPVGTKANKIKNKTQRKAPLQLKADQLEVPHAVFKQGDGTELSQLAASEIAPGSQGVAIVNIAEAMPYFQLTEAVSPHGIALLVLEFDDPRLPPHHQVMKVPMQSKDTHDPLIVSVAVVQLGHQPVQRNVPTHTIAVPEVPNQVIRVLVCKDQFTGQWSDFVKSPVKCLMQQDPFRQLQQTDVIDV